MFYCSSKCKQSEETFKNKLMILASSSSGPYRTNGSGTDVANSYEAVTKRNQCCGWCGKSTSFSSGVQRGKLVVSLSTKAVLLSTVLNCFTE